MSFFGVPGLLFEATLESRGSLGSAWALFGHLWSIDFRAFGTTLGVPGRSRGVLGSGLRPKSIFYRFLMDFGDPFEVTLGDNFGPLADKITKWDDFLVLF